MFPCITCGTLIIERDSLCAFCLEASLEGATVEEAPKEAWSEPHGDGCNANCWCWV